MGADNLNHTSRTNWEALESMPIEDIDYSDIPLLLTDDFFAGVALRIPASKANNFIELESDSLQWLHDKNQQPKEFVHTILRQYIQTLALYNN